MANDLLDVSRLEEGKMPIDRADGISPRSPARCVPRFGTLTTSAQSTSKPRGRVRATCDGTLVRRVLENLVSNGIKHTPAGSRIRISLASDRGRVRVEVHDQGRGVPPEAREKIFEKFGALQARHDRSYHSVGLGLAFCKLAIRAQGGTIGVDSGVPAGSTFWFELPA